MIALRNLALRRGSRLLLSDIHLTLHAGWKVGVVGRNGCGKSSLLAAVRGELDTDAGSLDLPADLRIASVAQETPALPDAAIDYVLGGDTQVAAALQAEARAQAAGDHIAVAEAHQRIETLNGYDARARAGRLMHGLGFAPHTHDIPVAEFSGGWRVRLNLGRALMAPSDLLLLDEPTNHLDLDAVLWLEQWLRRYAGTLLVISHDREFLDGVVSQVLHLENGAARLYSGDYSAFERQRAEQLRQQQIAHDKEQAERAHLQSFIDRFKAKATKARQAQSRMKRLEKLAGTEAVRAERSFHFTFPEPDRLPQSMLGLDDVAAGYAAQATLSSSAQGDPLCLRHLPPLAGEETLPRFSHAPAAHLQRPGGDSSPACGGSWPQASDRSTHETRILENVILRLESGDRVGLLGPNGAGKSTLVKTLTGDLPALAGERMAHKDLCIGYFAQHTVESLRAGESPFDHLRTRAPAASAQELRNWLGTWNFAGDRAFDPVDIFSGGERARLALALIAWDKPNLLLLDEPTNHLDLDMREALADALNDFPGAIVLVSHDRHLLGLVCDTFWRVADQRVERFDGDLDDYARWLRQRGSEPQSGRGDGDDGFAPTARERRRAAAQERERQKPLRQKIRKLDQRMEFLQKELADIEQRMSDPEFFDGDSHKVATLTQRQGQLRREQDSMESQWLELNEALDGVSA